VRTLTKQVEAEHLPAEALSPLLGDDCRFSSAVEEPPQMSKSTQLLMYPLPLPGAQNGADPFLTKVAEACRGAGLVVQPITRGRSEETATCFVHWPHYWSRGSTLAYSLGLGQPFARKLSNKRTIWDIHDLVDHRTSSTVGRSMLIRYYRRLYLEADSVIVHERSAIEPLNEFFGTRETDPIVARFGPYDVFHGTEVGKEAARTSLHLPLTPQTFLLFGTDRENRRHDRVVSAFLENSNTDQYLCVAGGNDGANKTAAQSHPRIRFFGSHLKNETVRDLFCAADFVVEHGVGQLTSGVVRTAISYGTPVISRDFGCTSDMAKGAAVWISDEQPLEKIFADLSALSVSAYSGLVTAARQRNAERTWSGFGETIASVAGQMR
jgi:hypothetical protein